MAKNKKHGLRLIFHTAGIILITGMSFVAPERFGTKVALADDESTPTATLHVVTRVIDDDGGTKQPGDFGVTVSGANATPSSFSGSSDGVTVMVDADAIYSVDQAVDPNFYDTIFGPGCFGKMAVGDESTCVITNNDIPGAVQTTSTVMFVTQVVNNDGGSKNPADLNLALTAGGSTQTFPGSSDGTPVVIGAGAFLVAVSGDDGYATTLNGRCSGNIPAGQTWKCLVISDDNPGPYVATTGTLMVYTTVSGGSKSASDFALSVSGNSASPSSFPGSSDGTLVILKAGSYAVSQQSDSMYIQSGSSGCSGTMEVGQAATCTISDVYVGSGTGSGSSYSGSSGSGGSSGGWGIVSVGSIPSTAVAQAAPELIMVSPVSAPEPMVLGMESDEADSSAEGAVQAAPSDDVIVSQNERNERMALVSQTGRGNASVGDSPIVTGGLVVDSMAQEPVANSADLPVMHVQPGIDNQLQPTSAAGDGLRYNAATYVLAGLLALSLVGVLFVYRTARPKA